MPTPRALPFWPRCLRALVLGLCLLCPAMAEAAVLPDGAYLIQMSDSDMTVDADGNAMRAPVRLWPHKPSARWDFQHLDNDIYKISTGAMVLDSYESIKKVGVSIIIFPWHGSGNQRWKVKRIGRYYSLINVTTGLAMELKGNNRVSNTTFHGNVPDGSAGQLFKLVDRKGQNPPAPPSEAPDNRKPSGSANPPAPSPQTGQPLSSTGRPYIGH